LEPENFWFILWPFGIFYGLLVYFFWPFCIILGLLVYFMFFNILWSFGIFYGHLVYFVVIFCICGILVYTSRFGIFMVIWCILSSLGIYFPFLVCCPEKNLATLSGSRLEHYNLSKKSETASESHLSGTQRG
jgi:hypothetical protein